MVFITCEIGTNWCGDTSILEKMVSFLKGAGADAIKLQALTEDILERHKELPYYRMSSVNEDNIRQIDNICKKHDIEWYCTPTDISHIKLLKPYMNRLKVRAPDCHDEGLVGECISSGKQVIISSNRPIGIPGNIVNLYCISKYPTNYSEINWDMLKSMDGYSNHCTNPMAILKAVRLGAKYIEFHVTPTKDRFILDNHVSFNLDESAEIIKWIRHYENWNYSSGSSDFQTFSMQSPYSLTWSNSSQAGDSSVSFLMGNDGTWSETGSSDSREQD